MSIESRLLNKLKSDQSRFALEALTRPAEKSEWEYGYRVGVVAGYEAAIARLLKLVDEEKNSDYDL